MPVIILNRKITTVATTLRHDIMKRESSKFLFWYLAGNIGTLDFLFHRSVNSAKKKVTKMEKNEEILR